TARLDDATAVFRVSRGLLSMQPYRLMDGSGAADLALQNLAVPPESRMAFVLPATDVVRGALERGLLGLAAETAGIVAAANAATFRYLNDRRQFGAPLASFQALQHRAANMEIAALELAALLELAVQSLTRSSGPHGGALLSALKVVADTAGRTVGHESVQLHGGMGVSDELSISHYARRLATIRAELGGADLHRQRFGTDVAIGDLLAWQDSDEARAWRQTVQEFTRTHVPEHIALKSRLGLKMDKEDYVTWQKILHEHGLFGDAWPREYGG